MLCVLVHALPLQDLSAFTRWESLFAAATGTTDVVLPVATTVVLHGCAQFNSSVSVASITIPVGSKVCAQCVGA